MKRKKGARHLFDYEKCLAPFFLTVEVPGIAPGSEVVS